MNKYLLLGVSVVATAQLYSADYSATECQICYTSIHDEDSRIELVCSHIYCRGCLNEQVDLAVKERNPGQLKCPDPDCSQPMCQADLQKITGDNARVAAIAEMKTHNLLDTLPGTKQCPGPDCNVRFFNEDGSREIITCPNERCKTQYCANCLVMHPGVSCEESADQCTELDDKSAEWLRKNTKQCPTCKARVEKINDGKCLLVHCGNTNCPEFCWHCGREHDHIWNCNEKPIEVVDSIDEMWHRLAQECEHREDIDGAITWYEKAAQQGYQPSMVRLIYLYRTLTLI